MTDENKTNEQETKTDEAKTQTQESNTEAKTLTQTEVNALIAKEKRDWQKKLEAVQSEYGDFKKTVEDKEKIQEEKLKTQVDELRKNMSPQVIKLLDKLTISEQYEWLQDPENKVEKKQIPHTPEAKGNGGKKRDFGTLI